MNKQLPVWSWTAIMFVSVLVLGLVDWLTGYELNFFSFYFLPVSIGAWLLGLGAATTLAVFSALVWFGADVLSGHVYSSPFYAVWNTIIRLVSFLAIGWSVSRMRQAHDSEQKTAETLSRTLSEIKVLEAFLPICAQCKKIRDRQGVWQHLEAYISQRTNTQFSHSYCPECAKKALKDAGLLTDKETELP
jgi:hypothetical protein